MPATSDTQTFVATPEALTGLHKAMEAFWGEVAAQRGREVPMRVQFALATAVSEVAANIIRHAQADCFDLTLLNHDGRTVEARLQDRGIPFVPPPEPAAAPGNLSEGGFGLALARRVVHALDYRRSEDAVNCWSLVVVLPPATAS